MKKVALVGQIVQQGLPPVPVDMLPKNLNKFPLFADMAVLLLCLSAAERRT